MQFDAQFNAHMAGFLRVDEAQLREYQQVLEVAGIVAVTGWTLEYIESLPLQTARRLTAVLWQLKTPKLKRQG